MCLVVNRERVIKTNIQKNNNKRRSHTHPCYLADPAGVPPVAIATWS